MRTTANITIKADARSLNKVAQQMEDAFNPARAEGMQRATEGLNTSLEESGDTAGELAEQLGDAAGAVEGFKKLKQEIRSVTQEVKRLAQELQKVGGPRRGSGGGGGSQVPSAPTTRTGGAPGTRVINPPSGGGAGGSGSGGSMASRLRAGAYGGMSTALSGIPIAGPAAGAILSMASSAYGGFLQRETGRRGSYAARNDATGRGGGVGAGGIEGVAERFGHDQSAGNAMYGQFMSGAGAPLSSRSFGLGMGAQQNYGVDLGTTGSLLSGFRRGSGATEGGARGQFAKEMSAAVTMGLDGAELTGYMQQTAQMVTQQAELGARQLDMAAYHTAEKGLAATVGGFQSARITRGFSQGVSEMGYSGAGGATEFNLAVQAGYRPGQGMDSYFGALQKMQDVGSNPELMEGYLERFMDPSVGGENTRTGMIQRALQATGVRVHADTARRIAGGDTSAIREVALSQGSIGRAGGVNSALVTEAGFTRRTAEAGADPAMVRAMQNLRETTITMQETVTTLGPMIELATDGILKLAGFASGMMDLAEPIIDGLAKLIEILLDW